MQRIGHVYTVTVFKGMSLRVTVKLFERTLKLTVIFIIIYLVQHHL